MDSEQQPQNDVQNIVGKNQGKATASLILGILGTTVGLCIGIIGIALSILAIIFGGISINNINLGIYPKESKGLAITGLVLGIVGICLNIIVMILSFSIPFFISQITGASH